jgi:hypothetical protein
MADFCRQCSEQVLGIPDADYTNDLSGLSTADDTANGLYATVICEGCGFIQVDHNGRCIGGPNCTEKHKQLSGS